MLKFLLLPIIAAVLAWGPTVGGGYPKPAKTGFPITPVDLTEQGIGNGRPLVITFSPGGSVEDFAVKAGELMFFKTPVIVDGPCLSACTILVDLDRANVCLTTNAVFGYHQSYWDDDQGNYHYTRIPLETPGLDAFLDAHGGPPANHAAILVIPFEYMKKFYRPCAGAV